MSWPLGSLCVLGAALAAGFAWYERSRPSARLVALVGTLAALAAVGRVAFAPLPNVKPTTDIVLISGYALGGAPGFVIGAVAALTSNLFFGQGPWTPWQMAGWGLVGLAGAGLGAASGRRLGRWPMAIACALAGYPLYGAIVDFGTWVNFSGSHSLGAYIAFSGTSFTFNLAHAAGNLVFALAFGPALAAALARFRARLQVTWRSAAATGAAALALGALGAGALSAPRAAAAASPTSYLLGAQNADGGWADSPGARSSSVYTAWAALGLAATGRNPLDVTRAGHGPVDYLRVHAAAVNDVGDVERTILVLGAAGVSPRHLGGRDLLAALLRARRADGSFGGQANHTAFGILALRAAGRGAADPSVRRAARWLARQQERDGGFGFLRRGGISDVDDTGAALQALVAAGRRRSATVTRALRYLAGSQRPDGGFPQQRGGASNAQSAAWAVQGLIAARRDPTRVRRPGGRSALAYLRSLVGPDGAVRYSRTSRQTPVWVTGQALTALRLRPFPLRAVPRARRAVAPAPRPSARPRRAHRAAQIHRRAPARARVPAGPSPAALAAGARTAGTAIALLLGAWL